MQRQKIIEVSVEKYDPDQPRDDHGRFGSGGGGGAKPAGSISARQTKLDSIAGKAGIDTSKSTPTKVATRQLRDALSNAYRAGAATIGVEASHMARVQRTAGAAVEQGRGSTEAKSVAQSVKDLDNEGRGKAAEIGSRTLGIASMNAVERKVTVTGTDVGRALDEAYKAGQRDAQAVRDYAKQVPMATAREVREAHGLRTAKTPAAPKANRTNRSHPFDIVGYLNKSIEVEVIEKGDWDESKYQRDDHGRFSGSGGGGGSSGSASGGAPRTGDWKALMRSKDVPLDGRGQKYQEKTAERLANSFGATSPDKSYRIGTPRLQEALHEAFAQGAAWGGADDRSASMSEVQEAIRNTGSSEDEKEVRAFASAITGDRGHLDEMVSDAFRHIDPKGSMGKVRDVVVSGAKIRSALKEAYAEGARATAVVRRWVAIHPNLNDW